MGCAIRGHCDKPAAERDKAELHGAGHGTPLAMVGGFFAVRCGATPTASRGDVQTSCLRGKGRTVPGRGSENRVIYIYNIPYISSLNAWSRKWGPFQRNRAIIPSDGRSRGPCQG